MLGQFRFFPHSATTKRRWHEHLVAFAKMTTYQEFLIMLQPLGIEIICFFFLRVRAMIIAKKSKETLHILELK